MEIRKIRKFLDWYDKFKIDFIVWKLHKDYARVMLENVFKIDFIVWKSMECDI